MNCRYTRSRISAYIDRELTPSDAEKVRVHLAECDSCSDECRLTLDIRDGISNLKSVDTGPMFEQRLLAAVREAGELGKEKRMGWSMALVPAAAIAAAFLIFSLLRQTDTEPEPVYSGQPGTPQANPLARDQAFDQARNPFSGGTTVSFEGPAGR